MRFSRKGISDCAHCPLADRRRVWGEGDEEARIIVLGEAPGRNEELEGSPFVGGAGKVLTQGLVQAGLFRRQMWVTNVACCRPPGNDIDSEEGREAVLRCRAGLEAELLHLRAARVVVPVGNTALNALGIEGRITTVRGSVYELSKGKYAVPTWHPAYIMRDRKNHSVWVADLVKAKEISHEGWRPPREEFTLFPTVEDVARFVEDVQDGDLVGVDIETTSLSPRYGRIVVVGLAKEDGHVLSVPLLRQGSHAYWSDVEHEQVHGLVMELFAKARLVFHNALFDLCFLRAAGWKLTAHEDTMLLHHAVHPELSHKLGFVVSIYGKTPYWKGEFLKREVGILDMPDESLRTYNARDAAVLLEVLPGLVEDAEELGVYGDVYRAVSIPLIEAVLAMQERGLRLSAGRLGAWKRALDSRIGVLHEDLTRLGSLPEGFNLDSDEDLRLLIYGHAGGKFLKAREELSRYASDPKRKRTTAKYKELSRLDQVASCRALFGKAVQAGKRTPTGKPSVDDESLLLLGLHMRGRLAQIGRFVNKSRFLKEEEEIRNGLTWLGLFAELRKLAKLRSTYTSFPTDDDGHVHPHFLVHGTTSGRLACRDPNLQNVPLEARKLFIPRQGYVFVGRDYSNLELRIAAILSHDERMLDAFRRGENLHDLNTRGLFSIVEQDPAWTSARGAAKIYVFGRRLYGGSQKGIYLKVLAEAPELELTFADFQKFDARFDQMYPELAHWQRKIRAEVLGTRMVRNAFGRVRIFLGQAHEIEREGLNHPIQSTAADLINKATIRVWKPLQDMGGGLVLQIHDELVAEVLEGREEIASELLRLEMERPVQIDGEEWIFPTEGKVGKDWQELK